MNRTAHPDIFISYCSKDTELANFLLLQLENYHLNCWIAPRNITGGDSWASAITKALQNCCLMILVYSSASNNSSAVLNEVTLATDRNMYILPVRVEDVELSDDLKFHLASRHWQDAFQDTKRQLTEIAFDVRAILCRIKNLQDDTAEIARFKSPRPSLRTFVLMTSSFCLVGFLVLAYRFNFISQTTSEATSNLAPATPSSPPTSIPTPSPSVAKTAPNETPVPAMPLYASLDPGKPLVSPSEKRSSTDLEKRLIRFVMDHYDKYNFGNSNTVISSYAPEVEYFNTPHKRREVLADDLSNYFERWQIRRSKFLNDFKIEDTSDPSIKKIRFSYIFYRERGQEAKMSILNTGYYKKPKDNRWCSSGKASDTLTIKIQNDTFSIIGENQDSAILDTPKNNCARLP